MSAPHVGEAAVELPWLAPCAASLVALARAPAAAAWQGLAHDPGAVLLLVRHARGFDLSSSEGAAAATTLQDADLLQAALDLLPQPHFIDWRNPALHSLFITIQRQAHLARGLAWSMRGCDPQRAWIGGLLAPLGWLAVAAVAPALVGLCLEDPHFGQHPATQARCWGLDHTAIARRLVRRWTLPAWLGTIVGHLGLPVTFAEALGAEPKLFEVVQLAVELLNQRGRGLPLAVASSAGELRASLGLSQEDIERVWAETEGLAIAPPETWEAPLECALLLDVLQMAIATRRQADHTLVERLQKDLDGLQRALETHCASEKDRLQAKKLAALAELAAGAGHEINNPLAVISGQAQYMLKKVVSGQWSVVSKEQRTENGEQRADSAGPAEDRPVVCSPFSVLSSPAATEQCPLTAALQTIVSQAQRIHQILVDLMQFARPTAPQPQHVELNGLLRGGVEMLEPLAQERQVRLVCPEPPAGYAIHADAGQVRQALTCLLRNAIEAAPSGGWAGLRVQPVDAGAVDLYVEDNGPGPSASAVEHLFDPFYSGRTAGRGRGLGLTTAWRLARQNHGDVHYAGHAAGVTRFVLHLSEARLQPPEPTNGQHPPANGSAIIVSTSC